MILDLCNRIAARADSRFSYELALDPPSGYSRRCHQRPATNEVGVYHAYQCRACQSALLDQSAAARELDLASELFHRINRIIPADQEVLTVPPSCSVRDAIAL